MTETQAIHTLWEYHHLHQTPQPADVIWGFGCHDEQVAHEAARLYHRGMGRYVLFTGGLGHVTKDLFHLAEADRFAALARADGVPAAALLLDSASTNTGENITNAKAIFAQKGLQNATVLAVDKPTRERRTWATLRCQWPQLTFTITSQDISLADQQSYYRAGKAGISWQELIALMVGDTQRMEVYAAQGFQIPAPLPPEARTAYETLMQAGYTKYLIP